MTDLASIQPNDVPKVIEYLLGKGKHSVRSAIPGASGEVLKITDNIITIRLKSGKAGVLSLNKIDGLKIERGENGGYLIKCRMNNGDSQPAPIQESLKSLIKKIVLSEITNNTFGTPDHKKDDETEKAAKKVVDNAEQKPGTGKVVGDSEKHHVEFVKNGDKYDVTSITNGTDRRVAKALTLDDAVDFAKKHAEETEKSYVEKAREKSINSGKEKKEDTKKKDEKPSDKMEDAEEKKQVDVADDNDKKAEEKVDKDLTAIKDDNAAQLGGEIVDKIDKIIDRVLKKNTVKLKADSEMESPDKLVVKDKGTPELKEKKS